MLHVVTMFLLAMAPRLASAATCDSHLSRAICMVFRRQDGCAWDEPQRACVADLPCDSRPAARCAYELTTGAPWDHTLNKCFKDAGGACRWSDECTRLDGAAACASAKCQWTSLCMPASERIARTEQGDRCVHKCTPPGFRGGQAVDATSFGSAPQVPSGPTALRVPAALQSPAALPDSAAASVQADSALASNGGSYSYSASYSYDCCGGDAPSSPPSSPLPPDVVVTLPGGSRLKGRRLRGADTFLGVPFAAAPVGELRWAAPAPLESWGATKVFDATRHGARCMPLVYSSLSLTADRASGSAGNSEECLNLNIFTPPAAATATAAATAAAAATATATATATAEERCAAGGGGERCPRSAKAVMVWVHGGCSSFGSNQAPLYDGAPLAATRDVIVVSLNYRLGALGFLGHDALRYRDTTGSGSTGNWGTLDAIAALRWVRENIAAFGGDPYRVTLFGQSSGAGLISQLLGAEPAWPYYHRVIMESGAGPAWTYQDMRVAYHNFDATANHAGCGAASPLPQDTASIAAQVRCLLAAPADVVASGLGRDAAGFGRKVYCRDGCAWGPVIDGALLKGRPLDLARSRRTRPHTPLLAGHNLNDGALFVPREDSEDGAGMQRGAPTEAAVGAAIGAAVGAAIGANYTAIRANHPAIGAAIGAKYTEAARLEYFARRFGPNHVAALGRAYPVPARAQVGTEISISFTSAQACETDFSYACATYWLAAENQAPSYIYQFSQAAPGTGLSLHGYEIRYVFGTGHFFTAEQRRVSRLTMDYWASFARNGAPQAAGGPRWPPWREGAQWPPLWSRDLREGAPPWPEPHASGALLNISASPSVVLIRPHAKGCAFLAREWEYLQVCLPENPRFNLSGPEVAPYLPPNTAEQPPPLSGLSRSASGAPLSGPPLLPEARRSSAASVSEAQAVSPTATDCPVARSPVGGASRLLWLLAASVAAGSLCFGAGIAVERRVLTRRRPASPPGTAPLLHLSEHIKPCVDRMCV